MAWWRRWLGRGSPSDRAREDWRRAWAGSVEQPDPDLDTLRQQLSALGLPEEEIELEQEMLDALAALSALRARLASASLPVVETGHRVIGTETCHFSAPASMPDHASQPAGRLLFTPTRVVFVGGGVPTTVAWHAVANVRRAARDLVLARAGGERLFRFRANAYADALCGAELAWHLVARHRRAL
jgi:hypothetical protein